MFAVVFGKRKRFGLACREAEPHECGHYEPSLLNCKTVKLQTVGWSLTFRYELSDANLGFKSAITVEVLIENSFAADGIEPEFTAAVF